MKTVRRAYAINKYTGQVKRVLIDNHGMIFYPGNAWVGRQPYEGDRLVFMPGELPHHDWFKGWWEANWQMCPDWVWCYGMAKSGDVGPRYLKG